MEESDGGGHVSTLWRPSAIFDSKTCVARPSRWPCGLIARVSLHGYLIFHILAPSVGWPSSWQRLLSRRWVVLRRDTPTPIA